MAVAHTHPQDDLPMTNVLTIIFLCTGMVLHYTIGSSTNQLLMGGGFYEVIFRGLSLIPVTMAIVINYPKFRKRVKEISADWKKRKPRRARKN